MTYDEFEKGGLAQGAPYALCKIAWEPFPFKTDPYDEPKLKHFFLAMVSQLPKEAMDALKFASTFEIEDGALEELSRQWFNK